MYCLENGVKIHKVLIVIQFINYMRLFNGLLRCDCKTKINKYNWNKLIIGNKTIALAKIKNKLNFIEIGNKALKVCLNHNEAVLMTFVLTLSCWFEAKRTSPYMNCTFARWLQFSY